MNQQIIQGRARPLSDGFKNGLACLRTGVNVYRAPASSPVTRPPLWVGFDLDGTAAHFNYAGAELNPPVGPVFEEMKARFFWVLSLGIGAKLFTARASVPEWIPAIKKWSKANGFPEDTEITCSKDLGCIAIIDDVAFTAIRNTGKLYNEELFVEWMGRHRRVE